MPGFRYCPFNDLAALEAAISPITAAILLEPVQGEGGVNVADAAFIRGAAALAKNTTCCCFSMKCKRASVVAVMRWHGAPSARKSNPMASPGPRAWAVVSHRLVLGFRSPDRWSKTSELADEPGLARFHLRRQSARLRGFAGGAGCHRTRTTRRSRPRDGSAHARAIRDLEHPALTGLRGLGLLLGFSLDASLIPAVEGKTPAQVIVAQLMERGLLTVPAGPDVMRFLPPLTVSREEIDDALRILHQTVNSL